jgi:hypothetical protein
MKENKLYCKYCNMTGPRDRVANKQLNDFILNNKTTPKAAPKVAPKAAPKVAPIAAPTANIIKNTKAKEAESNTQDKLAFQKVIDFVNNNKKEGGNGHQAQIKSPCYVQAWRGRDGKILNLLAWTD